MARHRSRTGTTFALVVPLSGTVIGCSGSESKPSFAVVEEYAARLASSDFEGAMALRCGDAQVASGDAAQFLNELDRIGQSAGVPLEVVGAEEVEDGKLLTSSGAAADREIRFRLRTKGGSSQPIHVVTVTEDGQELLCGYSVEDSFALRDRLAETPVEANPARIDDLKSVIEHAEQRFSNAIHNAGPVSQPNPISEEVLDGWGTFWKTGDRGGVTVDVYRFADATSAIKAAGEFVNSRAPDGTTTFDVPAMPNAIGLRHSIRNVSVTKVTRHIRAPRSRVYRALLDAQAVQQWMVPDHMTSHIDSFDAREGGLFRISLTYDAPTSAGKTNAQTDSFHGRFIKLVPDTEVVQAVEFESDDPAMGGEMTITYALADADGGTDLIGLHENLPPGVPPADNELGWRMSLAKLAKLVEIDP